MDQSCKWGGGDRIIVMFLEVRKQNKNVFGKQYIVIRVVIYSVLLYLYNCCSSNSLTFAMIGLPQPIQNLTVKFTHLPLMLDQGVRILCEISKKCRKNDQHRSEIIVFFSHQLRFVQTET